jgi:TetR/AcrR family transcriptional regulator, regulator of autoinduction and epiphytic fitness
LPDTKLDGRSLRAERTRTAIVDAHLALLDEGHLKTSAARIAGRAGVSVRALWLHFNDMETLYAATNARLVQRQEAEYRAIPADLPLSERVAAFCRQRTRMLEIIAPAARAAHLMQPYSPQLQRNRTMQIGRVRDEIAELFGPELQAAGKERDRLLNAILVATTFNAWQLARDEMGLDAAAAQDIMVHTVTGLIMTAPPP